MKPRLVGALLALVVGGVSFVSHSILTPYTPVQGVNHIYYGAKWGDFLTEQLVVGNIDGDTDDDIITGIYWDDPAPGGVPRAAATCTSGGTLFSNGSETVAVCNHLLLNPSQEAYWVSIGYTNTLVPTACDSCYFYPLETENQGAGFVFYGGNFDNVPPRNDLNVVSPGITIYGQYAGDKTLYVATGRVSVGGFVDQNHDILLGAPQWEFYDPPGPRGPYYVQQGRGKAFLILGSASLPPTIDLRIPLHVSTYVHKYFSGRDIGDRFAYSNAVGNINTALSGDEIIIAAPWGDGFNGTPENPTRLNSGEVYVFYPGANLPNTVDLNVLTDAQIAAYGQVIYGGAAGDYLGITNMKEIDGSGYAPPAIAIGDWDQDGFDDLVIGAGSAFADNRGAVYIIFGGSGSGKLIPGNTIDLSLAPGTGQGSCDMAFYGVAAGDALGTGVEFTDVDYDLVGIKKDLLLGAALADNDDGGPTLVNRGEAYIAFGAPRATLLANSVAGVRDLSSAQFDSYVDVVVYGDDAYDHFGAYFAGNGDFDLDQYNDFAIGGRYAKPDDSPDSEWGQAAVFFGKPRAAWTADNRIHLKTALYNKTHRIFKIVSVPGGESNKVRLAKVDLDGNADLVFGGYDAPGYAGASVAPIAGQMYIMKGRDIWKSGTISTNQTWRDNVFITGDLTIAQGATVTLEPGTDVYIWPFDWSNSGVDPSRVEFHVNGSLQAIGNDTDTPTKHIQFSVWSDSLKAVDRDAWWGIFVHDVPGASASFNYCKIANATYGLQANVDLTIKNSTIEYCDELGLSVAGGDSVYAEHVTIHDVGYAGVNMLQGMRVRLNDCDFYNMGDYGVKAYSGARLYANDTTIQNADIEAVYIDGNNTFADVDACILENNYRSLRVSNDAVASIDGSTIDENENYGVFTLYDGFLSVNGCTIKNSSAGIATFETGLVLTSSTLRDNEVGLMALQGSTPSATDCDIIYNGIGVLAMQGGNPNLGDDVLYGNNEIHHSTTYNVSNTSPGVTVKAENNYWKNSVSPCWPPASKINGLVDYIPALCSPPLVSPGEPVQSGPVPDKYGLSQNYPNPFNPTTRIPYAVPSPGGHVTIAIYNVRGQLVRTLVGGPQGPGNHSVLWDGTNNQGTNTSTGVYFVLMRAGGFQQARKIVLLK